MYKKGVGNIRIWNSILSDSERLEFKLECLQLCFLPRKTYTLPRALAPLSLDAIAEPVVGGPFASDA